MPKKPLVLVIGGPTASGKTALGIQVAKKLGGEIISSDSMQIYQEMNIGTAKPTMEERKQVPHHLVDFVSPTMRYSVAEFQKDALRKIEEILQKGKIPIIVGGTGLYIDSLIYGIDFPEIAFDEAYRNQLEEQVKEEGLETLWEKASRIDPEAMQKISKNDKKRILRVLEIYHQTGKTKTQQEKESRKKEVPYDYHVYAITMDRDKLYERINTRVDQMIQEGLIEEVEALVKKYNHFPTAMQGLGYKEVVEYLEGSLTKQEMIDKIKQETRRYAKRQLTWFRKNKQTIWLDASNHTQEENVELILEEIKKGEQKK